MRLFYIYILLLLFQCFAFSQNVRTKIPESWKKENPEFANQGEQEDYWAWKFFFREYEPTSFDKYEGKITEKNNILNFTSSTIECNCNAELKSIFTTGILYPEILDTSSFRVSNLEELSFLSDSPKIKRFRFWL